MGDTRDWSMTPWLHNAARMDAEFGVPERDLAEYEQNLRIIAGTPAPAPVDRPHVDDDDDLHPIDPQLARFGHREDV